MSLEFMDGFDHDRNDLQEKWDSSSSFIPNGSIVHFPSGGTGLPSFSTLPNLVIGLTSPFSNILAPVATRTVGVAMYFTGLVTNPLILFRDVSTTQVDLRLTSGGALVVTRNGTVLQTSSRLFVTGRWYYIEFQATINSVTGSYTVQVTDGGASTVWLTASGVNTQATANATMDGVQFTLLSGSIPGQNYIDDVYILNSAGATNNTFLGECRVITAMPTSDGATLQWTPNSGTAHFSRVNETPPDNDTSYNSTVNPGDIDLYGYPAIASTGGALAMQINMDARKDDLGSRSIASQYKSGGGTSYTGSTDVIASNFIVYRQIYETDPDTGLAWTYVNINAAKFGVKCIA